MDYIRIERLRGLVDTGSVRLPALTVLVGKNSSGKSTFLRFLPLLRQSLEEQTTGPILWFGRFVDFGDYSKALTRRTQHRSIRFTFGMTMPGPLESTYRVGGMAGHRVTRSLSKIEGPQAIEAEASVELEQDRSDVSVCHVARIEIRAAGHRVEIDFARDDDAGVNRLTSLQVNGRRHLLESQQLLAVTAGAFLPLLYRKRLDGEAVDINRIGRNDWMLARPELEAAISRLHPPEQASWLPEEQVQHLWFGTREEIVRQLGVLMAEQWFPLARQSPEEEQAATADVVDLVVCNALGVLVDRIDDHIAAFGRAVQYAMPVRATAERYYRQRDYAVREVDARGQNLTAFIRGLSSSERSSFQAWTTKEFGWHVESKPEGGHMSLVLHSSGQSDNLADVGFGFSQLLPIVAQLWTLVGRRRRATPRITAPVCIAVEQPELHLHPALQAQLIDAMLRTVRFARKAGVDVRLVLETHSEAIVGRIGRWVAEGQCHRDDAQILLFEPTGTLSGSELRRVTFDEQGFLEDWPYGFFEPPRELPSVD